MVVDALSYDIVSECFRDGALENMNRVVELGGCLSPCTSIFPSITPAATCSIVTGSYPRDHGIEGACWFDRENEEVAYFGDELMIAIQRGLHQYLIDFGDRLNFERLRCPTLFEQLETYHLESACINYLWFAGSHVHRRATPLLLRLLAGAMPETVRGPRYLKLGDFVETLPGDVKSQRMRGVFGRYGFGDDSTAECLIDMAQVKQLPPFTLAYFPSNDDASHKVGPEEAADRVLDTFDRFLGRFVRAAGGWEQLGKEFDIIMVGDHAQDEFRPEGPEPIDLDACLSEFQLSNMAGGWQAGDQMCVCPNMRAAAIYTRHDDSELTTKVRQCLLAEQMVDQVITVEDDAQWHIATADRGSLSFRIAHSLDSESVPDRYGNHWMIEGDLACVDASVNEMGISFGDYPNAFERIAGAFVKRSRPIWATARVGAEFRIRDSSVHAGGSHGALHANDSDGALLTSAGIDLSRLPFPSTPRIIDVATLVRNKLNIESLSAVVDY